MLFCRRKSMTGNWKTNQGSAMLEQLPITEKYKAWIDEVSERFNFYNKNRGGFIITVGY